jgi:hypothetical protein
MENTKIIKKVKKSLDYLFKKDGWLLINDLSERSIAHKLAEYLQWQFQKWEVDCEYNGDVDRGNNRKSIDMSWLLLKQKKLLTDKEEADVENEIINRGVYPDIIVHKRGTNRGNLCIIEIKKSTSNVTFAYDDFKLKAYTSSEYGNTLMYPLGIFIEVVTGKKELKYRLAFYSKGERMENIY